MDPYLERHWRDVHASLIIYLRDAIQELLPRDLVARTEERVFMEYADRDRNSYPDLRVVENRFATGPRRPKAPATAGGVAVAEPLVMHLPDERVTETFVEIIDASTGRRVVTVIEVLSLSNKRAGEGDELYRRKQQECRDSQTNLVEIDLLRGGRRGMLVPQSLIPESHKTAYQVQVHRLASGTRSDIYRVPLRERLPVFAVPLRPEDEDVAVDLQALIDRCYRNGRYDEIDYSRPPDPPLEGDDAAWAAGLIAGRAAAGQGQGQGQVQGQG
jgi:hypothetical protein